MSDINDTISNSMGLLSNVAVFGASVGLMRDMMNTGQDQHRPSNKKMTPKKKNNPMEFDFGCRL